MSIVSFDALRGGGVGSISKNNKLGVVTYKSAYDSPMFKCAIQPDQSLRRLDNNRMYFTVSSFVDSVEAELYHKREEQVFNAVVRDAHASKHPKLEEETSIPALVVDEKEQVTPNTPCTPTSRTHKRRFSGLSLFGMNF